MSTDALTFASGTGKLDRLVKETPRSQIET